MENMFVIKNIFCNLSFILKNINISDTVFVNLLYV